MPRRCFAASLAPTFHDSSANLNCSLLVAHPDWAQHLYVITNEHQYRVALANREKFRRALEVVPPAGLYPTAVAAMQFAARQQLAEIESDIRAYETSSPQGPA